MKGYPVKNGYMGYIPEINSYMLFCTEDEYVEYYNDNMLANICLKERERNYD